MPRQLLGTAIAANTITTTQLQTTIVNNITQGGGPRVSSLVYPDNDTAANTAGGQTIYVVGSGFATNAAVYINGNAVPSISFISSSNLQITTPALSSATYPLYVINPENGATAIHIPGLIVSGEPTWVTSAGSLNAAQDELSAWSYSLSATGDVPITYALAAGSSLPTGVSLASNGTISGTISSPTGNVTTYTFSVVATDAQNQDSTRQFTVTTSTAEGALFANNALLIHADGTNNGNNHHFLDSSNNNFAITRNGNATQGSFSPFSQTGWSAYFDGNGDYLSLGSNANLGMGAGNFTVEFWIYKTTSGTQSILDYASAGGFGCYITDTQITAFNSTVTTYPVNAVVPLNSWNHVAFVRSGTTLTTYLNGNSAGTNTTNVDFTSPNSLIIGRNAGASTEHLNGYLSNLRLIKGTALYTSNFTPPSAPLAPIANTSLLALQSNRLVDEGPNNFTLTRNGDVSVQAFAPFAPGLLSSNSHSVYFDGSGDSLNLSYSTSAFDWWTSDYTIEAWVYSTNLSTWSYSDGTATNSSMIGNASRTTTTNYWSFGPLSDGKVRFKYYNGGSVEVTSSATITNNTWNHIAMTKTSSGIVIWVNGVGTSAAAVSGTPQSDVGTGLSIGQINNTSVSGYISNLRVVKGAAVYTTTFTPSTTPLTAVSNTSLLTCQSTTFIDNSTNAFTITPNGNVAPRKFNPFGQTFNANVAYSTANVGGSAYFDGTGDYLTAPANTAFAFSGDFTIEFWVRTSSFDNNTYYRRMICFGQDAADNLQLVFFNGSAATSNLGVYSNSILISGTIPVADGDWHHIALCRSGSSLRLFVDGTQSGSTATTSQNFSAGSTNGMFIGRYALDGGYLLGHMSNLRVLKGTALYTTTFTPPTGPLTNIANTSVLLNFTNAQIFDQTAKNVLETVGDAKISTSVYKYGTGSIAFDGTGDRLHTGPSNPLLALGTGNFTVECWVNKSDTSHRGIWQISSTAGGLQASTSNLALGYQAGVWQIYRNGNSESASYSITTNTWYHTAVVRNSGTTKLYVNGTEVISVADTNNYTGTYMVIGGYYDTSYLHNGYIDDVRITRGYARYTSNFTAPTSAFKDK